jgi:hypothetical protein
MRERKMQLAKAADLKMHQGNIGSSSAPGYYLMILYIVEVVS